MVVQRMYTCLLHRVSSHSTGARTTPPPGRGPDRCDHWRASTSTCSSQEYLPDLQPAAEATARACAQWYINTSRATHCQGVKRPHRPAEGKPCRQLGQPAQGLCANRHASRGWHQRLLCTHARMHACMHAAVSAHHTPRISHPARTWPLRWAAHSHAPETQLPAPAAAATPAAAAAAASSLFHLHQPCEHPKRPRYPRLCRPGLMMVARPSLPGRRRLLPPLWQPLPRQPSRRRRRPPACLVRAYGGRGGAHWVVRVSLHASFRHRRSATARECVCVRERERERERRTAAPASAWAPAAAS
jgi:hypothetical protein